ncbi:MAG: P-loop NTPase family protein [Planctomycetota bacterium]|jgi:adenylate kinase family enzyme
MSETISRICIVGCSGAGKSTLARQLSDRTGIPVIHLDKLYWKPGWEESENCEFVEKLYAALKAPSWIVDGNFSRTAPLRFEAAQVIIQLDYSKLRCIWGVLKRVLKTRGKVRPDMGDGCPERFDWSFIKWVWNFNRSGNGRDRMIEQIKQHGQHCTVIHVRNRRQLRKELRSPENSGHF